jgi:hypothetical protein
VSAKLAVHGTLEADGQDPSIIKFNDEPGRTKAGVIALLRETIRRRRSCDRAGWTRFPDAATRILIVKRTQPRPGWRRPSRNVE